MLATFKSALKIKEVKTRLMWVLILVALVRLIQNVPMPGIDAEAFKILLAELENKAGGGAFGMLQIFSGGALQKCAIGVLGIMPYITASIIMQLMTPVFPQLEKMQKESEEGRQKLQQWTRYLTVLICLVQGFAIAKGLTLPGAGIFQTSQKIVWMEPMPFILLATTIFTGAAFLIMWLGEMITEKGIGQGASLIITISIISSLPQAVTILWNNYQRDEMTIIDIAILAAIFMAVSVATVALIEAVRKIPVKYARRGQAGSGALEQTTFLPLKVNHAGVMPIIFAGALLMFPGVVVQNVESLRFLAPYFAPGSFSYLIILATAILIFTFFWVATQFNPIQIADDLKRSGGFIPGHRPGEPTANFLNYTMSRITTGGAIFLTIIAVIPNILNVTLKSDYLVASFFGGTSLLIMVGVVLQTVQQLEVMIVQHNYDSAGAGGRLSSRDKA